MERDPLVEDSDDSDDEDYVLECEDNLPSEEDCDGDPEEDIAMNGDIVKSARKRKPHQKNGRSKKAKMGKGRRGVIAVENDDDADEAHEINQEINKLSEEDEKKKTDSLWSDFLQGTDCESPKQANNEISSNSSTRKGIETESPRDTKHGNMVKNMVTITEVFEFAGEEVKINKTVLADSSEAKNAATGLNNALPARKAFGSKEGYKPVNGGGLSAVLGKIGKKTKIGTLEKSKIDWERYKSSEGLQAEIQVHNRGRDGFLEKQDFLQRADVRQFEIEKQMRKITRSSR